MTATRSPSRASSRPPRQDGLSIVELMIGITLGLIIVGAVTVLFANNTRTRQETEKTSQQIENGRYAAQMLLDDLRLAGSYGEFSPTGLATPATLPDPSVVDGTSLAAAIALPVQGYDGGGGMPGGVSAVLADRRAGTDVLVVRRASTCVAGSAGCDAVNTGRYTYFQTALCPNQLSVLESAKQFLIGTDTNQFSVNNPAVTGSANPPAFLAKKDCATPADRRAYYVRIFFIANNNDPGDGIPTLKVADLGAGSFAVVPLVAGIEQMQFEYGLDTNNDGAPENFTAAPANAIAWRQVTAVKIHLLARNLQNTAGFNDTRSYVLGAKADGTDNTFGPYGDTFKRHVYTTAVRLNNVAGRLE